jgi:LmbE family N-acetylglucosaminyl deacetylase
MVTDMNDTILIVAAHPDDEVLGCGGTIAKFVSENKKVHISFLTDGVSARDGEKNKIKEDILNRQNAAKLACSILGAQNVTFGKFPDNRMDSVALLDIIKFVEQLVIEIQPNIILTHHAGDLNIDHRRTHEAVATACRPLKSSSVNTILCFEIPSSTEWSISNLNQVFIPNWYFDITNTLDVKLSALEAYRMELKEWPHPRSIKGVEDLAHWRGATIGVHAAEAFSLGRKLV